MMHKTGSRGEWFAAKRFGFGAGMPIRWQGWATYLAFIGVVAGLWSGPARGALPPVLRIVLAAGAVALLLVVVARHTQGGLRWRWGE